MKKVKNSTGYSQEIDDDHFWVFTVPENVTSLEDKVKLKEIQEKILYFNRRYIEISSKFSVGMLIGTDCLKLKQIELEDHYIKYQQSDFYEREVTNILPRAPISYGDPTVNACCLESTLLYLHNDNDEIVGKEVYDVYKYEGLNEVMERKAIDPSRVIDIYTEYYSKTLGYMSQDSFPLDMTISLKTNIFYYRIGRIPSRKRENWMSSRDFDGIDNTEIAMKNTPRFNSYLRDVMKVWEDDLNWEVSTPQLRGIKNEIYCPEGLRINGELIYFEDIS